MTSTPIVFAHRGASMEAPENTLAAFREAWRQKADGVECDVWLTADGELAICHDESLLRVAGVDQSIRTFQSTALRTLDAGSWKGERWAGERVPLLREVLKEIPPGRKILIEVKGGPETVEPLVGELAAARESGWITNEQVEVISFRLPVLQAMRRADGQQKLLLLIPPPGKAHGSVEEWIALALRGRFEGLNIHFRWLLEEGCVEKIKAAGLRCYGWTVNDPKVADELWRNGVDAVTTDVPGLTRKAFLSGREGDGGAEGGSSK